MSVDKTQDVLLSFLNQAFEAFRGVPQELLTDNMKTVMDISRTNYYKEKVNNKFQQFADDYGFKVHPSVNTKAKFEAPMKLLDEIRAYNGTLNYEELHKLVADLNNRINSTCHTSTGKIPILHLEKEKDFLSDHRIHNQKLNYDTDHYAEISALTFNQNSYEMIEMAKNNLKMIGEVYQNE